MAAKHPEDRINIKQVVDELVKKNPHNGLENSPMAKDDLDNTPKNESQQITRPIFCMEWSENRKKIRGTLSDVFQASFAGVRMAVKKVKQASLNPDFNDEVENILKFLDHPNVLKLFSVVHKPQCKYFALELCSATLKEYGSNEYKGPMPFKEQGLYQMACGLDYIHSQKLIHRDIKPSNVLISGTKPVQLKWSDFGSSKTMDEPGTFTPNAPQGTYDWMAPEILRDVMDNSKSGAGLNSPGIATTFSDIFSAGCVFFFFLEPPPTSIWTRSTNPVQYFRRKSTLSTRKVTEVETKSFEYDLIAKMINPKPEKRIPLGTVIEVLESYSNIDDDSRKSEIMTPQLRVKQTNELAYGKEDIVGQGSFGPFFIDFIQLTSVAVIGIDRSQFAEIVKQEEFNWFSIDHENVAKFVANVNNASFGYYATELHVMSLDELYGDDSFEGKSFLKLPSDYSFLHQLTSGLDFIHSQGLIYCNINPQNVLLFTLSRVKWANQLGLKMKMTPKMLEWTAPEILERNDNLCYKYCDPFSDIFSAGCVFFFFLTKGIHLFAGGTDATNEISTNNLQCKKMNLKLLAKESWIVDLIEDLTEPDPDLRPSAAGVMKTLTSFNRKLSRLDKERLSIRYFSDIRSISEAIPTSSSIKGTQHHSVTPIFSEIKGVIGKAVTYYPNTSRVESFGFAGSFVFEGEKVSVMYNLGDILMQLHHPNVIKPYFNVNGGDVVEHCVASLDQLFLKDDDIKKYRGPMPTDEQVLFQITSGLDYIHSKDIIHRNIRPENILIVASSKSVQMKISNFKFSVRFDSNSQMSTNTSNESSINWVSPEEHILVKQSDSDWHHGIKSLMIGNQIITLKLRFVHCDTFSCGCVLLYFLLRGIHPFGSVNLFIPTNIARANPINLKELPRNHFARPFITRMIEINPEQTIPLSEVLDYLKSILPNDYLKTRNRLSNFYYIGNLNLVHRGSLSSVHYVNQQDGTPMIVRRIPLEASSLSLELMSKVFDELKALHHPNIVKMFEFDHDGLYRYFSMEFCKISLDQWIKIYPRDNLHEGKFLFQLTSGLLHIHAEGLVHGSIKPSNIFIAWMNDDRRQGPNVKLSSDFGIIRENQLASLSSTPIWLAPEILEGLLHHSPGQITVVQCTRESDIFAAGNAFFYYWSRGQNLYSKIGATSETLTNILNGNQVNLIESTVAELQEQHQKDKIKGVTRWMTQRDPKQRPTLHQVIEISNFFNPFPPPADKLEEIHVALIGNQQPVQTASLKIQYSKDHCLGISADVLSKVFLGLAVKTMDRQSQHWNHQQPVPVAVKRMATVGVQLVRKDDRIIRTVPQERKDMAQTLMNLNHANVVKLYSFARNSRFTVLALEKCRASLAEYFRTPMFYRDFIQMPSDKNVLVQMAKGLDYIHSQNLNYRDVKPENVLVSESNPAVMKWADFGITRAVISGTPYFDQSKFTGSERWLANEIIDSSQANSLFNFNLMVGSVKCDIFALGCIFFFFLLSGMHPFGDDYNIQDNIRNENPVNIERLSSEHFAFAAIKRMIAKNIFMRPKLSDVISCLEKEIPLE